MCDVNPSTDDAGGLLQIGTRSGVIVVSGEIDMATAPWLRDALRPSVQRGGLVRLNLRGVTFIDSSGLHLLADTAADLRAKGRLVVVDSSPVVRRAVALVGRWLDIDLATPGRHRAA